jgi:DNA-directed RNA polymerase specialized sigma24 family protein
VDIPDSLSPPRAGETVAALYAEHALGLVRLAVIMTGDQASAEDIVQDAFLGLYRRWEQLADTFFPLAYVRASVLNGCRSALRRQSR